MAKSKKIKEKKSGSSAFSVKAINFGQKLFFVSLPYLFCVAAITALTSGVAAYALSSPTFELREVKIENAGTLSPDQAMTFCGLRRGQNLIRLDINAVMQDIRRRHPEFKEVRVRRVLPDRVEVILKRRMPCAQLALNNRMIQIDKDLVILQGTSTTPFKNLPLIEGARIPRAGVYVGVTMDDPGVKRALALADAMRNFNVLRGHTLNKINIADSKNIFFIVDSDIEIRMGGGHFIERLKILDQALNTVALDRSKIRYIDLRFDDVVIGPRDNEPTSKKS